VTSDYLKGEIPFTVHAALVLGSGLNPLVREFELERSLPYSQIPNFPIPTVYGHQGTLHIARFHGDPVAVFEGRLHAYEGFPMDKVVYPVTVAHALGAETLVVTNAAGGIHPSLNAGSFMLIKDQINLMGHAFWTGHQPVKDASRFVDMSHAYSERLRAMAREIFVHNRIRCFEGVLAAVSGPCYETPAEIRMMEVIGADAVCMSTIPEVIMANVLKMNVLGISLITNRAAGRQEGPLDHHEVMRVGKQGISTFSTLIHGIIKRLSQSERYESGFPGTS
jgi:purine-nucleoside phosphorylase